MSCDFCNNIKPFDDFMNIRQWERIDLSPLLVKYDDGDIGFYVECDDYYYSGIYLHHVKFCPRCGRKLEEE